MYDCLVSLVVKTSALRAADLGSDPAWAVDLFPGRVMPVSDLKLLFQLLPCQAPCIIGSVLGLVSPVSVYCDQMRWKVWSATFISVQHVHWYELIRLWDTLACCWDKKTSKQPTNSYIQVSWPSSKTSIQVCSSVWWYQALEHWYQRLKNWCCSRGWNRAVDSVLGSLSCTMQHHGFNPSLSLR